MNKKYKTLLSNTVLISIGTFTSKLLVFLMVRFYTGYLTTSDYSTADLITQTANLLFPIISLGITEGVFRFALDKAADRRTVFTYGFLSIVAGSVLFLAAIPIVSLMDDLRDYAWLIVVYTLACSFHALCSQYIRAIGKTALFAVQGIINTVLVIALNILFLAKFDMGIIGYVLSVALADMLCTLFLFFKEKLWRQFTFKLQKSILKEMLKYSVPLIPTTIFWWITSVSSRYIVNEMVGSDANGIYTVAYKLPTLLTLVSTMFMQAWQFSAIDESETDIKEQASFYSRVWSSFQAVMFLAGSGVILFAKPVMKLLTTKEFYSAWQYIPFLSVAMVFTAFSSFTGTVYNVKKKSMLSFFTAFLGASINICLNFVLIPSPLGVQGAAIATAASYFIVFIVRGLNSQKYIPYKLKWGVVALNSVIFFAQSVIMILQIDYWIIWQIVCFVALVIINFGYVWDFIKKIFVSFLKGSK